MPSRGPGLTEDQLLRIADLVPALVALYNIKTARYLYVNRAALSVLGYTSKEFMEGGLGFAVALVHPDDVQGLLAKNQAALEAFRQQPPDGDEPVMEFEYRMKHKDGSYRWVRTDGTVFGRGADGDIELILNVTIDITEHRQTEEQLKRTLAHLEQTLKT